MLAELALGFRGFRLYPPPHPQYKLWLIQTKLLDPKHHRLGSMAFQDTKALKSLGYGQCVANGFLIPLGVGLRDRQSACCCRILRPLENPRIYGPYSERRGDHTFDRPCYEYNGFAGVTIEDNAGLAWNFFT